MSIKFGGRMVEIEPISPLISLEEAAKILLVSPRWLRDHADEFGGTRDFGKLKFFREIIYGRLEKIKREVELRVQAQGAQDRQIRFSNESRSPSRRSKGKGTAEAMHDPHNLLGGRN
jgi:hypothetical protein